MNRKYGENYIILRLEFGFGFGFLRGLVPVLFVFRYGWVLEQTNPWLGGFGDWSVGLLKGWVLSRANGKRRKLLTRAVRNDWEGLGTSGFYFS